MISFIERIKTQVRNINLAWILANLFVSNTPNPVSEWVPFIQKNDVVPSGMTIERGLKRLIHRGAVASQKMSFVKNVKKK